MKVIKSPKLGVKEKKKSLYPYYAGFSEDFVKSVFNKTGITTNSYVLDPWNGSGTTTYVSASFGCKSIGVDLNPVLSVISSARTAEVEMINEAKDHWEKSKYAINSCTNLLNNLAKCYNTIYKTANRHEESWYSVAAVIKFVMFLILRKRLYGIKTKNPTWYIVNEKTCPTVPRNKIYNDSTEIFCQLIDKTNGTRYRQPTLITDDFVNIELPDNKFDLILTSPPYLTRLDYVKATLPELIFLSKIDKLVNVDELRKRMLGTPLVGNYEGAILKQWGSNAARTLKAVKEHPSKASDGYYLKFYLKYFDKLYSSLSKLSRMLKEGSSMVIVIQNSYYKELVIDLVAIIKEMLMELGLKIDNEIKYKTRHSFVYLNKRAKHKFTSDDLAEYVLFFKKENQAHES
mgnify:CR=1 FL=1